MIDLDKTTWRYTAHFNMGYEDANEDDTKERRHKGYRYRHECKQYPRLHYIDSHYTIPDKWQRDWYVDGDLVGSGDAGMAAAIEALGKPVVLTLAEFLVLSRIPHGVKIDCGNYLAVIIGRPANVPPDKYGHVNELDDPLFLKVWGAVNYLRFKGMVKWREGQMERAS